MSTYLYSLYNLWDTFITPGVDMGGDKSLTCESIDPLLNPSKICWKKMLLSSKSKISEILVYLFTWFV